MADEYLPLGCFGKLPCYADFLSGKVFLPTSLEFKDWVLKGHGESSESNVPDPAAEADSQAKAVSGREVAEKTRYRFLYGHPGSMELLVGVIRPSADSGQRRRFPFAVFAHVPRQLYARQYPLLAMGLAGTWEALADAWQSLANVATKAAFEEVLPVSAVPGPAPVESVRQQYKGMLARSATQVYRERGIPQVDGLLAVVPEVVRALKGAGDGQPVVLEVTVAAGEDGLFETTFWIELINHQFMLKKYEPAVFIEEADVTRPGRALLIFGALGPKNYAPIMGCAEGPLAALRAGVASGGPSEEPVVAGAELTFADLVGRRVRGAA